MRRDVQGFGKLRLHPLVQMETDVLLRTFNKDSLNEAKKLKTNNYNFVQTKDFKTVFLYYPDYQLMW